MVLLASCIFLSNIGCLVAVGEADLGLEENEKDNRASGKCKWGYGLTGTNDGPDTWPKNCSPYCNGTSQSPVNIETKKAVEEDVGMIKLFHYDKMLWGNIQNNGKTLGFTPRSPNPYYYNPESINPSPPDLPPPYIEGGRLPMGERFEFHSFHWHWGSDPKKGSEHTINGKSYPLELHLVHVNTKYKDDLNKALSKKDGLAVLGVLYELVDEDDHTPSESTLDRILEQWKYSNNDEGCLEKARTKLNLRDMLPVDLWKYYYYNGSLTTPMCNEAVLWTVFWPGTLNVTKANLKDFNIARTNCTLGQQRYELTNNFRPTQPLNGRKIYTNKAPDCCVRKTVGGIDYVVEGVSKTKSDSKCMNNCIFTPIEKVAGPKNCFMAGNEPVESCEKPKP